MQKIYFVLLFVLLQIGYLPAQESDDQTEILQLCVDLPELQENYKEDQLYFMAHGVQFSNEIEIFYKKNVIKFYDKLAVKTLSISDFFLLWQFGIKDNSAKVIGNYVLDYGSENERYVPFEFDLEKNKGQWEIAEYKVSGIKTVLQ